MDCIVAIPTVNNLEYLKKSIRSVLASFQFELLVIDNGSTDGTLKWLQEQHIHYIHHDKNFGVPYANNEMMDYAFSKNCWLFPIHNDVILHKDCLNNLYTALNTTDCDTVFGLEVVTARIDPKVMREYYYKFVYDGNNEGVVDTDKPYTGVEVSGGINFTVRGIKKSTFDKVGYIDVNFFPAYFDDNDYGLRCSLANIKHGLVPSAMFYHFWSRSIHEGGVGILNRLNFEKNRVYYIKKWGGAPLHETNLCIDNIKILRTREEDYALIKDKMV